MKSLTKEEGVSGVLSYGLYKIYKERYGKYGKGHEANVSWPQWLRICKKFNTMKMESVIKGCVFVMPYRLGSLGIIQYKKKIRFDDEGNLITKGLVPDWNKSILLWRKLYPECNTIEDFKKIQDKPKVYMTNEHTDGRRFRFHWKKKNSNIKNLSAYKMCVSEKHKKALSRMIFDNPNVQFSTKI